MQQFVPSEQVDWAEDEQDIERVFTEAHDFSELEERMAKNVLTMAEKGFIQTFYKTIKRNDPCPCGSGKKFKKCHRGRIDALNKGN